MRARTAIAALVLALGAATGAACSSDQDPGLGPEGTTSGPKPTSHPLADCSAAPDATIPVGGCLDADGKVIRPGDTP